MKLSEIMNQLAFGELSQLALTGENGTGILEEKYPIIIASINLALTKLHTRFSLKSQEVMVQLYEGIDTYYLQDKFAISNTESTELIKYIVDTSANPFKEVVLLVEQVVNEEGDTLYLNNSQEEYSVFTPTFDSIQIPFISEENTISVLFRADHEKIDINSVDIDNIDVKIPTSHLEPLLYFVASRIHSSTPDLNGNSESNVYLSKYEAACQQLENTGLDIKDDPTNYRLHINGWV